MGRRLGVQASIVGILIAIGCLAVLLRQVDLKQSWNALGHLSGPFLLVPLGVFVVNLPLRAWRWQLSFPASSRPPFSSCLTVLAIGNMANFLLPGRAGDLARCALARPTGSLLASSRTLATLAVEKVLDGLALVGMVLFAIWTVRPPAWVLGMLRPATFVFGGALVLLVVVRYRTQAFVDLVRRIFRRVHLAFLEERFDGLLTSFADGLAAIASAQRLLILVLLTAMIWVTESATIWGLAHAMGMAVLLKSAVAASGILGLGLMIPAAPGGLGTYELFGTEAFKIAGLSASSALALTAVIHAWVFLANVLTGMGLLAVKGLSLAKLRQKVAPEAHIETEETKLSARPSA